MKTWTELEEEYRAGCEHCTHPMYAGIRCGVCGRWTDEKARTENALQRLSDFHQEAEASGAKISREKTLK